MATMSGHIYSLGTPADHHPLKTWPAQVPGRSQFVARHDQVPPPTHNTPRTARIITHAALHVIYACATCIVRNAYGPAVLRTGLLLPAPRAAVPVDSIALSHGVHEGTVDVGACGVRPCDRRCRETLLAVQVGVYAKHMTRQVRDIRGTMFPVEFEIIDKQDSPAAIAAAAQSTADGTPTVKFAKPSAPYTVKILLSVRHPPQCRQAPLAHAPLLPSPAFPTHCQARIPHDPAHREQQPSAGLCTPPASLCDSNSRSGDD